MTCNMRGQSLSFFVFFRQQGYLSNDFRTESRGREFRFLCLFHFYFFPNRVAFQLILNQHLCSNSQHRRGIYTRDRRHLEILGYRVEEVTVFNLIFDL